MTTVVVPARPISTAVLTRLGEVLAAGDLDAVYDGEVPPDADVPRSPLDPERCGKYAVLYASPGYEHPDSLGGGVRSLDWSCQVTVAAGRQADCLAAVDDVRDAFTAPLGAVTGLVLTRLRPDPFTDTGPVRRDPAAGDRRYYLPLLYRLTATLEDS